MLYKTNNPHGGDIYGERIVLDYSVNVNPFGTPEAVKRAVCEAADEIGCYPDPYCRELIKKIAEKENVPTDNILCGNGAEELIYSYFGSVMPKKAAETAPTFSGYSEAIRNLDCNIIRYDLSRDNDFDICDGVFSFLQNEKPGVFIVCNPNNPTGRMIEPSFMKKILEYCYQNGIRLFVDECFLDLATNGASIKDCLSEYKNLFILKAFTKNYAMAGLRLGYALSSDSDLLKKMSQRVQPWNVSLLAQKAGIAALSENAFMENAREYIARERQWLSDALIELGFRVCPSDVNYILFYGKKDLDIRLKEKGILIRNCKNYHGLGEGWFRIAVRLHDENVRLIDTVKYIIER